MARTRVRGLAFFRTILFLPQVIALVVVAVMWKMVYDPENGSLNRFLGWFGIEGKSWLGDFNLALPSVGLIGTWVYFGLAMVLLTRGRAEDPVVPVRRRAGRRRRPVPRVLRRHAAGAARARSRSR